jgi:hypothetical protein
MTSLPDGMVGQPYSVTLEAEGGDGEYTWRITEMGAITNAHVREVWRELYRKGAGKEEIKASPLPSPAEIKAILQAIEDAWVANLPTMKAAMDTAAGVTLANSTAKVYGRAWLALKARRGG